MSAAESPVRLVPRAETEDELIMTDGITTGEIDRRLNRLEESMSKGFADVNRSIAATNVVHTDRYEAERTSMNRRIEILEERMQWVSRAIIGTVLSIVVGAVVTWVSVTGGG